MAKNWSIFQQEIFNKVADPSFGSFTINAVAGSGKTTTIVESAFRESKKGLSILFLAFNKSAVNNVIRKISEQNNGTLPYNIFCKTLHSHGFEALRRAYKQGRLVNDSNKWNNTIKETLSSLTSTHFEDEAVQASYVCNIADLLNKCRINLVKAGETREIANIADHFGIDLYADEVQVVSTLLSSAYRLTPIIDFSDMITTSVFSCKRNVPKYDLVFVDEAQDLNKAEHELLLSSLAPNGRFVAVGDPKQAINGFAGADCDSFANLTRIAGGKELPLSVCYRCGKSIVELAQSIVPNITAFEGAEDGLVRHTNDLAGLAKGDMILCRKTAPLVGLCLKLIASGIPANVAGRDISKNITDLIKNTKATTLDGMFRKLDHQIDLAVAKAQRKGLDPNDAPFVVALRDKVACIEVVADKCTSVSELIDRFNAIFTDIDGLNEQDLEKQKHIVTLSTVHKAKGLEADNVWIVVPDKLPLRYKGQRDWQFEQEMNLCYVAYTRAKKILTFVDLNEAQLSTLSL